MLRPAAALLLALVAVAAVAAHQIGIPGQTGPVLRGRPADLGPAGSVQPPKKGILQKMKDGLDNLKYKTESAIYDARVHMAKSILPKSAPPMPKCQGPDGTAQPPHGAPQFQPHNLVRY